MNKPSKKIRIFYAFSFCVTLSAHGETDPGAIKDLSPEDGAALRVMKVPKGLTVSLYANGDHMTNPVALDIDKNGQVYVAETYRFNRGTAENRSQSFMLDDDLQVQTLEDRRAMYEKWAWRLDGGMDWFTSRKDQIKLLTDTDGDGRADQSSIFATFGETLDGLAAGVLPWGEDVWVTCIPHLWRLRDADGDGVAEETAKVHTGFGVRASFFGHDMHGLTIGPDNRLYFSVGDRGYHVKLEDGSVLAGPEQGAVFRCRRDGSQLEVIHRGMRNPQELAFDEWGNLFAGDNNCDKGDKSRLVYVIDGGDSGWRMHYQSVPGNYRGGPWMAEHMWSLDHELAPVWLTPSAGYIGSGPSGLAYSAVGAWPEALRNRFYHCNFSGNRGVETFRTEPAGAGFRLVEYQSFLAPAKIADGTFGYDGRFYAAEFLGSPWAFEDTGRIYTISHPEMSTAAAELKVLAAKDFSTFDDQGLLDLLSHEDQRLRLRGQDELATREKTTELTALASNQTAPLLQRVHAIWGLWQIGLNGLETPGLTELLTDSNAEIRAQAWRVHGDLRQKVGVKVLRRGLDDESLRVKYFVVRAIGRVKSSKLIPDLLSLSEKTSDRLLQQAVVIALERMGDAEAMIALVSSDNRKLRMIAVLTLRRMQHPAIKAFIVDADDVIALEAARAVHDLGIAGGTKELAQATNRALEMPTAQRLPMLRRAITANRQVGDEAAATRLIKLAVDNTDMTVRRLALEALESWGQEVNRDPVTGEWRPITPRDVAIARRVTQEHVQQLFLVGQRENLTAGFRVCQSLKIPISSDTLGRVLANTQATADVQELVFKQLASQAPELATKIAAELLARPKQDLKLIIAIHSFLANSDPKSAVPFLAGLAADDSASIPERQSAIKTLAALELPAARDALRPLFNAWRAEKIAPPLLMEISEAATVYGEVGADEEDITLRVLYGGKASLGKEIFYNHQVAQCFRCHQIGNDKGAGDAGPNLAGIASRLSLGEIRQSLVEPGARIAPGFGIVSVTLADGSTVAGMLRSETPKHLEIGVGKDPPVKIAIADIVSRSATASAMPPLGLILKKHELRDLIAFLSTQRTPGKRAPKKK